MISHIEAVWFDQGALFLWSKDELTNNSLSVNDILTNFYEELSFKPVVETLYLPEAGSLKPQSVQGLLIDSLPEALAFLTSELPAAESFRPAHSLQFWIESSKFLLELLTHGQFLPTIEHLSGRFFSRWKITLGRYEQKFKALADAMPLASCTSKPYQKEEQAAETLKNFLELSGEELIRTFLARRSRFGSYTPLVPETVIEHWYNQLSSLQPEITHPVVSRAGNVERFLSLEKDCLRWLAPVLSKDHPLESMTAVFSIVTPATPTEPWILRFGMKTKLGLLSPEKIYTEKQTNPYFRNIERELLKAISYAAEIFPVLFEALNNDTFPSHFSLKIDQAYEFMRSITPLLRENGYDVSLPSWWRSKERKLGLHLKILSPTTTQSENSLGLKTLTKYSWEVMYGDQLLTAEEFKKILESDTPLIQLAEEWVELDGAKLRKTADFIRKSDPTPLTLAELLRLGFEEEDLGEILPVIGLSADGWLRQLLERSPLQNSLIEQPKSFLGELRPYQLEGLRWLQLLSECGLGGCLADDMGLGKTIQFITLILLELEATAKNSAVKQPPSLLIVPLSILGNWERELAKFAPEIKYVIHHGASRLQRDQFLKVCLGADIVITTYSLAYRDEELFKSIEWTRIALDEAHNIKNHSTKQTSAIKRLALGLPNAKRLALTGTPLENHLEELWSIFDFLNPGYLGTLSEFRKQYALKVERFRDNDTRSRLSKFIRPFILRRLKTDPVVSAELPEKIEMNEYVDLTPTQAILYEKLTSDLTFGGRAGIHRKGLILALITKLKQICDHPVLLHQDQVIKREDSGKLIRLEELLGEMFAEGDRVLLFTQFAQMGAHLQGYLRDRFDREVLFLHGGMSRAARERELEKFRAPNGPSLFILSLKAGGYGLNLTEANQVIHFDQWWNPAVQDQATDRAYRIGQTRQVQVRRLITRGTLEERIQDLLTEKRKLSGDIIGETRNIFTELSHEELASLLNLSGTEPISYEEI
jgi:SNF2 family DNA or RNA helicase